MVVGDAGDLFVLALSLNQSADESGKKKKKKRASKPVVIRQLNNTRVEPSVPTISVRKMPVSLTG